MMEEGEGRAKHVAHLPVRPPVAAPVEQGLEHLGVLAPADRVGDQASERPCRRVRRDQASELAQAARQSDSQTVRQTVRQSDSQTDSQQSKSPAQHRWAAGKETGKQPMRVEPSTAAERAHPGGVPECWNAEMV